MTLKEYETGHLNDADHLVCVDYNVSNAGDASDNCVVEADRRTARDEAHGQDVDFFLLFDTLTISKELFRASRRGTRGTTTRGRGPQRHKRGREGNGTRSNELRSLKKSLVHTTVA